MSVLYMRHDEGKINWFFISVVNLGGADHASLALFRQA